MDDSIGAVAAVPAGSLPASALVLRLALGIEDSPPFDVPWQQAMAIAVGERCAPLCWLKSGRAIRRLAPASIVDAWRAQALAAAELADRWTERLAEVLGVLAADGLEPVVLKGLPLAHRLYGSVAARPLADLDLFIAAENRAAAHRALTAAGWIHRYGVSPDEGVYVREIAGARWLLEAHSALADDNLLRHLCMPAPGSEVVEIHGARCRALDGSLLAGYLALHLAKHQFPPLLWLVDFHALWTRLTLAQRAEARRTATQARIGRYLDHAVRRTDALESAAKGDVRALRLCGITARGRIEAHNAVRVAALAATPGDAAAVIGAWLLPRELRRHPAHLARKTLWRLRQPVGLAARTAEARRDAAPTIATRSLSVENPDLLALVRELVSRDAGMWITVCGTSMLPEIPPGSRLRLVPLPGRRLRSGEVVLAELPSGQTVAHRVVADRGGRGGERTVRLRGDNNNAEDPPIPRKLVAALADAIEIGGQVRPVPPAPVTIVVRLRRARARVRMLLVGGR